MLLTSAFLRATAGWRCARKVLNISSGLGRRAMASQAAYCAAKAGMDHFTRCVALEEAARPNGAQRVLARARRDRHRHAGATAQRRPGPVPGHRQLPGHEGAGALTSPADAAARVLALLARPDFGANPVADVRG